MSYTLGRTWFIRKKLSAAGAVAYLQKLNRKGQLIYGDRRIRGTQADYELVQQVTDRYGEFQLCLIPAIYFQGKVCGNRKRVEIMKTFFRDHHNILSKIPPLMVREYDKTLILLDGSARADVAGQLGIPLLGYVPERLIPAIKGLTII